VENRYDESCPKTRAQSVAGHPVRQDRAVQANVRKVKAGVSIPELAEDIARRTLLQGLNVRPYWTATDRRPACSKRRPAGDATARWSCW